MTRRRLALPGLLACVLLLAGCPKGNKDFNAGKKAEALQDYDTALLHYQRALKADPSNAQYRARVTRIRFEAGQAHVDQGRKLRAKGELQLAAAEFEKARAIDPASAVAEQELRATLELLAAKAPAVPAPPPSETAGEVDRLVSAPPKLKAISREPINLKVTNDARLVFDTIGKLAGITVVIDPDFQSRRITTELTNVTLEDALDIVALQSKAFWKPVTSNIIFVATDNQQKRRDLEEMVVRTFYLNNNLVATDLTEVVNSVRQVLQLTRVQQVNSQNAIVVRDTPDKILLAEKLIRDIDRARPEVVVQVSVLGVRRDLARELGITPGGSAVVSFTPQNPTGSGGTSTTPSNQIPLDQLKGLSAADWSITLPGATATALLTDSTTKIIQNPTIRVVDGQQAKLRVGDRVPIATGSFQAGVGVGGVPTGGVGTAGLVNPLVNTQFQYIDVGVNVDVTPRIHPNGEISMKVAIEVSNVAGRVNIGGIEQPIIAQRKIEHDIRLREGEVNILGGIVERTESKSISGWPGLARIPVLRYLFSGEKVDQQEGELIIVLNPRLVRVPEITEANLRGVASGSETNVRVRTVEELPAPPVPPPAAPSVQPPAPAKPAPPAEAARVARIRFEPPVVSLRPGEAATVGVVVEDVKDLFSIPLLLQFNKDVIAIEDVRHGGFLSGGTQEIAIVHRIERENGRAIISATRQPNTAGVSGSGTVVNLVVRAVAAGTSQISVLQVSARDSQQKAIPMVSSEATLRVQ
jgi:general secretion pathway protein D